MTRFLLRRLLILPIALLAINFVAFSYAHLAQRVQQAQNPFGSNVDASAPILTLYRAYLGNVLAGDWGQMPLVGSESEAVRTVVLAAASASLTLVTIAFLLSLTAGLLLGLAAVRPNPPGLRPWLPPLASMGLASPSFFVGAVGIALVLALYLRSGPDAQPILPLTGYGLDLHLVLPVLALAIRPTMQIAQTTAAVLVDELGKQHVVTARSLGIPLRTIRSKHALRNVLPAVILVVAAALRLLVGELILVEWLFGWPGLGKLLASGAAIAQRHPWLLLTAGTAVFLLVLTFNLLGEGLRRQANPTRVRRRKGRLGAAVERASSAFNEIALERLAMGRGGLTTALGVGALLLLVVGSSAALLRATAIPSATSAIAVPGGHLWAAGRHDAQGTYWANALGPVQPQIAWTLADESGWAGGRGRRHDLRHRQGWPPGRCQP